MQYYATCINARLAGDVALLHVLPLQPSRAQIVSACRDGILLWSARSPAQHANPFPVLQGCLIWAPLQRPAYHFCDCRDIITALDEAYST